MTASMTVVVHFKVQGCSQLSTIEAKCCMKQPAVAQFFSDVFGYVYCCRLPTLNLRSFTTLSKMSKSFAAQNPDAWISGSNRHSVQWVEIFREKKCTMKKKCRAKFHREKRCLHFPKSLWGRTWHLQTVEMLELFKFLKTGEIDTNWKFLVLDNRIPSICHFWHFACEKNRHNHTELQHGCVKISKMVMSHRNHQWLDQTCFNSPLSFWIEIVRLQSIFRSYHLRSVNASVMVIQSQHAYR